MPRTETCSTCNGQGIVADYGPLGTDFEGDKPCIDCSGNGYVPVPEADEERGERLQADYHSKVGIGDDDSPEFPFTEHKVSLKVDDDLTNATPPPGRMANQTWRILEEQRQAAEDTVRECENEIERWTNKMVDAMKTKGVCEAGQAALEGGV